MTISTYLEPTHFAYDDTAQGVLGQHIKAYSEENQFPDIEGMDIAIIGVPESRCSANNGKCEQAPDVIREHFYALFKGDFNPKIVDLGNIKIGQVVTDTYAALADIMCQLMDLDILPVILGGSQDLTYGMYNAYAKRKQIVNLFALDNKFDLGDPEQDMDSQAYLSKIIVEQPNYLFTYSNAGFQTYLVDQHAIRLMDSLNFDAYRLGMLRHNIQDIEPVIRNADFMSVDISVIRKSDAPGNPNALPVGLFGEEASQIMRYAGMNEKMSSIGFFEYNPGYDHDSQTAQLVAIMMWCFIEGFYARKHEYPYKDKERLTKFIVTNENSEHDLVFYKSKISDRWWLEIPCNQEQQVSHQKHYMIPCNYGDYEKAMQNEFPDRWLLALRRFS